jgi:hypothetical protein
MRSLVLVVIPAALVSVAAAHPGPVFTASHEHLAAGARVSTEHVPVGGGPYCVTARVRASAGAQPFFGIDAFDVDGKDLGDRWVIGGEGYDDGVGDHTLTATADGAWHAYAATVTLDAETSSIVVAEELVGDGDADFEDVRVAAGSCAPSSEVAASPASVVPVAGGGCSIAAGDWGRSGFGVLVFWIVLFVFSRRRAAK